MRKLLLFPSGLLLALALDSAKAESSAEMYRQAIVSMQKDVPRLQGAVASVDVDGLLVNSTVKMQVKDSKELAVQGLKSINDLSDQVLREGKLADEIRLMVVSKVLLDSLQLLSASLTSVMDVQSGAGKVAILRWLLALDAQLALSLNTASYSFVMERARRVDRECKAVN